MNGLAVCCILGIVVSSYGIYVELKMEEAAEARDLWALEQKSSSGSSPAAAYGSPAKQPEKYEVASS